MAYDYDTTHEKILEGAKTLFLLNGYERTNLREICASAGMTNGAFYRHFESKEDLFCKLVEPCAKELINMQGQSGEECFSTLSDENILKAFEISNETIKRFINYVYENLEVFKLILLCSDGTVYSSFIEKLVDIDTVQSLQYFDNLRISRVSISIPHKRSIHLLTHCYFTSVFECVVHEYTLEDALSEANILADFFNAGWKKILGI